VALGSRYEPVVPFAASGGDVLEQLRGGRESLDRLIVTLYDELREIAHRHRAARGEVETIATTALVHEAYLKLVDQSSARWNDRAHFLALAAIAMRHILVDRAKARLSVKRGGGQGPVTIDEEMIASTDRPEAMLEIDDALDRLARVDARLARVVECRFFGGMTNEEIAEALGITSRTVERDWTKARMLLRDALNA
jgi:RNA polymerase sigma factor (TIGR02999 family)